MAHHRPHARVVFPNPGGVRAVYPVRRAYGNDEDGIIAHLWDVTATGVRFRLYTTRYQRWCGKTAIFGRWIAVWRR